MYGNYLFSHLDSARDAGAREDGVVRSRLNAGIELGQVKEAILTSSAIARIGTPWQRSPMQIAQ